MRSVIHKRAALDLTVGMLITIVLSAILLGLIVYGVVSGDIIPLANKMGAMMSDMLIALHLKSAGGVSGSTVQNVSIPGVGSAVLTMTENECKVDIANGRGYRLNLESGKLEKYFPSITMQSNSQKIYLYYNDFTLQWYWSPSYSNNQREWAPINEASAGVDISLGARLNVVSQQVIDQFKNKGASAGSSMTPEGGTFMDIESYIPNNVEELGLAIDIHDSLKEALGQIESIQIGATTSGSNIMVFDALFDSSLNYFYQRALDKVRATTINVGGKDYYLDFSKSEKDSDGNDLMILFIKDKELPYGFARKFIQTSTSSTATGLGLFNMGFYNFDINSGKWQSSSDGVTKTKQFWNDNYFIPTKVKQYLQEKCR